MTKPQGPILVTGATGQQGGAVARELLRRGRVVHAFTRAPESDAARRLAERGATIIAGDLNDPTSVRRALSRARAVFSVQTFTAGVEVEVRQGRNVAEAARDVGVDHVVYSSVDGAERGSGVPHFESKWAVEQHLRELDVPTTVLRPTSYIDNFGAHASPRLVDGTLIVRQPLPADTPLQMIATADIGRFAADAFERPDDHLGRAIVLAGDELTGIEIAAVFEAVTGTPARYEEQPLDEIEAISDDLALMLKWIAGHGYRADIAALRDRHPDLRTLRDWLEETA